MFGFNAVAFLGGLGLLAVGAVILAGVTIGIKEVIFSGKTSDENSQDERKSTGERVVGWMMIALGVGALVASFMVSEPAGGGPAPSTTAAPSSASAPQETTTTVPSGSIAMRTPNDGGFVDITCDSQETACWIDASGVIGSDFDATYQPYVLIAYGNQPADFYVQYDSTVRSGSTWTAKAYVEGRGTGDPYLMRVVLVHGSVEPPAESGGLEWSKVLDEQAPDVVAESADVHVTAR